MFKTNESQRNFYNNIKAGAESGWDFSSRWFIPSNESDMGNLLDISTSDIIPVDLNAFLQNNAQLLSKFNNLLGNYKVSRKKLFISKIFFTLFFFRNKILQ